MKVLAFRLFGDFGHYRPYYTTSSPTTYSLMPPTTIIGVIGAILGLEKDDNEYYKILTDKKIRIGIHIEGKVKKISMSTNLINTKGNYWVPTGRNSNGPRTPTRFEFVKDAKYVVYVTMDDHDLLDELAERIKHHCIAYTISLGLAGLLADVEFLFYENAESHQSDGYITLDSAAPLNALKEERPIEILPGIQYCKEQYVKSFRENRIPQEYVDVLFATNGVSISVKAKKVYEVGGKKILFINE